MSQPPNSQVYLLLLTEGDASNVATFHIVQSARGGSEMQFMSHSEAAIVAGLEDRAARNKTSAALDTRDLVRCRQHDGPDVAPDGSTLQVFEWKGKKRFFCQDREGHPCGQPTTDPRKAIADAESWLEQHTSPVVPRP